MAKEPKDHGSVPTDQTLVEALAKLVNASEDGPIKQVSVAKAEYRTPWYRTKTGVKRKKIDGMVRFNGVQLRDRMLSDKEVELLNALQPGKYHGKRWLVMQTTGEEDGRKLYIFIPNKTQGDRIAMVQAAGNLEVLLQTMIDEGPRA